MNFDLTEEQQILQRTVKEFSRQEIDPVAAEMDRQNKVPDDLITRMALYRQKVERSYQRRRRFSEDLGSGKIRSPGFFGLQRAEIDKAV